MWIFHRRYEATSDFIGLIWRGWAVVGLDIASDAWGIIAGKYYVGWYWELDLPRRHEEPPQKVQ